MIIELDFGPHLLRCDPEATRRALDAVALAFPERCGCRDCLNFIAARERVYTSETVELLARPLVQQGIAPGKEVEALRCHQLPNGLHRYEVWMHFAGTVLTAFDAAPFEVAEHVSCWCSRIATGPIERAFGDGPVAQVAFIADLPWLIGPPTPEF